MALLVATYLAALTCQASDVAQLRPLDPGLGGAVDDRARLEDQHVHLGDAVLDRLVLGDRGALLAARAAATREVDGEVSGGDGDAGVDGARDDGPDARIADARDLLAGEPGVLWHQHVFEHDVVAAGAAHPDGVPGLVD